MNIICSFIFTSATPPSPLYMFWPPSDQDWVFEYVVVEYNKGNGSMVVKMNGTTPIVSLPVKERKFGVMIIDDGISGKGH